ncbi:MAG: NusG domain II-containing protein [Oscillospiraceae bacterium]|nr:NusG domain II-containing protein [Oscillospiraceae bacterium]
MDSKFFKKTDLWIIAAILAVTLMIFGIYNLTSSNKPAKAEIYYESKLLKTIPLDTGEDLVFSTPQNEKVVFHLYSDGSIKFESSDCPDKVCVHSGRISMVGQSAACLPNKFILKIVRENNSKTSEADIIT